MISTILNKKSIPYFVIAGLLAYVLMIGNSEEKEIVIPEKENSIEIKDPIAEKEFDTIYKDSIIEKEILKIIEVESKPNQELLQKYEAAIKANDSLQALEIFSDAIKERNYIETLEDKVQVVTVKSSVIGTLKSQSISYKTKEIIIKPKTKRIKPSIYVGGFTQLTQKDGLTPSFGVNVSVTNKKTLYSIGIDNNKTIFASIGIRIFNPKQ